MERWFWTAFFGIVLIWYIAVTVVVSIKGAKDIKKMFES